jgi:hypothetical protein
MRQCVSQSCQISYISFQFIFRKQIFFCDKPHNIIFEDNTSAAQKILRKTWQPFIKTRIFLNNLFIKIDRSARKMLLMVNKIFVDRGGRVCLDNLKQFLSDKLLRFMPLPLSAVVCSSKPYPVSCRQVLDDAVFDCKTQNMLQAHAWLR